jgi:DNA-binding CsgD family transcriptional regulator
LSAGSELLERGAVLAALGEHLAAAARGRGRLVLLPGEAGVGKSAVLARFSESAGAAVHIGRCDPLSTPRPLGPWAEVAPALGVTLDELSPGPGAVSWVLRRMLAALGTSEPTVLALEDVHWADEATLDLICLLARRIDRRAALVIVSFRDDQIGASHPLRAVLGYLAGLPAVHRLAVEPLSPDGVARLAAGRRMDPGELHQITGGNPFFVTEVLASGGEGIPASVADAVGGRLARLSAAARRTAEAVAVIGSPAPLDLVKGLIEDPTAGLDELLGAGLLQAAGSGVGYRHELARLAVLDAVPAPVRAELHARVLGLLRDDPMRARDHALLAHHADGAADAAAVLEYAPTAAGEAAAVGAFREAADQLARAVGVGSSLPLERRAALVEQFAQFSGLASRLSEAADAFASAVELRGRLGDRLREGDDLRWLSFVLWPLGRCAESLETGRRAVAVLETLPPTRELAAAYLNLCRLYALDHRGIEATGDGAEPAISLGLRFDAQDIAWEARYYRGLARYTEAADDGEPGWTEMESARAGALDAGLVQPAAFMTMLMGMSAAWRRDHPRSASAVTFIEELLAEYDMFSFLDVSNSQLSYRRLQQGRWEDAAELAARMADHPGPAPIARILPLLVLGLVRARRGDPEVREPLDQALAVPEPTGSLLVRAARAEAAWLAGDLERARDEARCGLDSAGPWMDPWVTGELARWLRLAGGDASNERAAGPFGLELAGNWRAAATEWEKRGCPYDAALARLEGDVTALIHAEQVFDSLGARPAAAIARARLRARGVRLGGRGPRSTTRANPHGLTSRQVEIFELVAGGLTDSQIAALLHLSSKTVNHHVGAVLTKLGVHSRAEAVRRLAVG